MNSKGLLLVISGPSGCGKGTVCSRLIEKNKNIKVSVSATTRDMRAGETEGVTYFFKKKDEFEKMIENGEFLEYNCGYSGRYYGTPKKYVFEQLENGNDVILEIEMNGADNVKKVYPDGVFIFLAPPSIDELKNRLIGRGRESMELIAERFGEAKNEIKRVKSYTYVVENDTVENAVERIEAIIKAEKCSVKRNTEFINELIK